MLPSVLLHVVHTPVEVNAHLARLAGEGRGVGGNFRILGVRGEDANSVDVGAVKDLEGEGMGRDEEGPMVAWLTSAHGENYGVEAGDQVAWFGGFDRGGLLFLLGL